MKRIVIFALLVASANVAADFSKIANDGSALPNSAYLGNEPKDWACSYDASTELTWEVKTGDKGFRDGSWTYTYQALTNSSTPTQKSICFNKTSCDTDSFVKQVNSTGLCNITTWRLPTFDELKSIIYCSDGKEANGFCSKRSNKPQINTAYFPHLQQFKYYWSASTTKFHADRQMILSFYDGLTFNYSDKNSAIPVILVSNSKPAALAQDAIKPSTTVSPPLPTQPIPAEKPAQVLGPEASKSTEPSPATAALPSIDWNQLVNISMSASFNISCPKEHPHLISGGAVCRHGHLLSESRPDDRGAGYPNQWNAECYIPNQGITAKPSYIYGWCF